MYQRQFLILLLAVFLGSLQVEAGISDLVDSKIIHGGSSRRLLANRKMVTTNDWQLIWADEFTTFDSNKWSYQKGDGCQLSLCGWGNQEQEWYTSSPDNVRAYNGKLVIEAREEIGADQAAVQQQCWDDCGYRCLTEKGLTDGSPEIHACTLECGQNRCPNIRFTSGRINTADKFSISPSSKYPTVRVEARISLDSGIGLWPAFWMLGQGNKYGGWPDNGEIDIMESHTDMTGVNGTIHYGGAGDQHQWKTSTTSITPGFHVYRVDWSEQSIKWYVDNKLYGAVYNTAENSGWWSAGAGASQQNAPFGAGDDQYLLLNLAVGGAHTGYPSPESISTSLATSPKRMVVDYVRVYGR